MQTSPARIPVALITGAASARKRAFIHTLLAARPPAECWAVLDNDIDPLTVSAEGSRVSVITVGGCACCTGQIMLQAAIVRLLRQSRPVRLIIAVSAAAEPAALAKALEEESLARAIDVTMNLCVTDTNWTAYPPPARQLLFAQMQSADHLLAPDAAAWATLTGAGMAAGKMLQPDDAIRLLLASPAPVSSASSRRISS